MAQQLGERVAGGDPPFEAFLEIAGIGLDGRGVIDRVPGQGSVVVIANHPFGGADALAVAALVTRARPDVRILANRELLALPGVAPYLLPLDILGDEQSRQGNLRVLREGLAHLRAGGCLLAFPAGAVAHWQREQARVADPPWPGHVARMVARAGASVVPVGVRGQNGPLFHLLGAIHPFVRSALLPRAFLAMRDRTVTCRAGEAIAAASLPSRLRTRALRQAVETVLADPGN